MFDFTHVAEDLRKDVDRQLSSLGFLCRVFGRSKSNESFQRKLSSNPGKYSVDGKLVQDLIGIRVVLYFHEDITIVQNILDQKYSLDILSSTIDTPASDQFSVTRYNLIYKLPEIYQTDFNRYSSSNPIDKTFEVQIRSILSEGWHEVDHDLRYKCKENWDNQLDLSRALNGINATLQTAEWSLKKIFDDLSYRHYKNSNWIAMLQSRLRLRLDPSLSPEFIDVLNNDSELAKNLLRINRAELISMIHKLSINIPINLENIICIWNFHNMRNEKITKLTVPFLLDLLRRG